MADVILTALGRLQLTHSAPDGLPDCAARLAEGGMRLDIIVGLPGGAAGGGAVSPAAVGSAGAADDINLLYIFSDGHTKAAHRVIVPAADLSVPSLVPLFPEADWPERRIRDLMGVRPVGHPRAARLVRHAHWPKGFYPLTHDPAAPVGEWGEPDHMQLVRVRGEGVHEIPVGPIHAGIIEPGHFRFSADGERIIALEPRLFYVHRGLEQLARGRTPDEVLRLAEVVSGDTAIGHGWAFCEAVEAIASVEVPRPAQLLRAALLEAERIAAHVTDLGAILNDVALPLAFTQFLGLREDIMRANAACFGHRMLRGVLAIGGVSVPGHVPGGASAGARTPVGPLAEWARAVAATGRLAQGLAEFYVERDAVVERFERTGALSHDLARQYRAVGLAARASGIAHDARLWSECPAYRDHEAITQRWGDVMARYLVRVREVEASARLLEALADEIAPGVASEVAQDLASGVARDGDGLGSIEGWRGECLHFVRIVNGRVSAWAPQDPSAHNWRLLPLAVTSDVIPDFPVVNKSFNLSYAGNDL